MADSTKKKNKGGRPRTEFSGAVLADLEKYEGPVTNTDLQRYLGISSTVFFKWRKEHPKFDDAVTRAKDKIDDRVENALLKRALGYTYDEITEATKSGDKDEVISKIVRKELPPEVKAAVHWLNNRRPDTWREKKTVEVTDSYHEKLRKFMEGEEGDDPE